MMSPTKGRYKNRIAARIAAIRYDPMVASPVARLLTQFGKTTVVSWWMHPNQCLAGHSYR